MKETRKTFCSKTAGFTLIELMITVAIIGILVSLSVPTYLDYTVRAKVSEALQLAAAAKVSIAEFYISNGVLPATLEEAGIEDISTRYVQSIAYERDNDNDDGDSDEEKLDSGRLVLTLSDKVGGSASGKKMVVRADIENTGLIVWTCKPDNDDGVPGHLLPSSCRGV